MYIVNIEQGLKFYYNRISSQWHQNKNRATDYSYSLGLKQEIESELIRLKKKFPDLIIEIEE